MKGGLPKPEEGTEEVKITPKRQLESGPGEEGEEEDPEAKRRRILEETRDIDADSDGSEEEEDSSDEDRCVPCLSPLYDDADEQYSDDEDETAELQRELEKIKRERAERREQEVSIHVLNGLFTQS